MMKSHRIKINMDFSKGCKPTLTRSSSNSPLLTFSKISRVARSNAISTLWPDLALVSTNKSPSSWAHISASSVETSRFRLPGCDDPSRVPGTDDASLSGSTGSSSEHRSTLLPTRIHVRCGSACSRTSCNHERAFTKPKHTSEGRRRKEAGNGSTLSGSDVVDEKTTCRTTII